MKKHLNIVLTLLFFIPSVVFATTYFPKDKSPGYLKNQGNMQGVNNPYSKNNNSNIYSTFQDPYNQNSGRNNPTAYGAPVNNFQGKNQGYISTDVTNPDSMNNPYSKTNPTYNQNSAVQPYNPNNSNKPYSGYTVPYDPNSVYQSSKFGTPITDSQGNSVGVITQVPYSQDSVSNPYSQYGNPFSQQGINQPYGPNYARPFGQPAE